MILRERVIVGQNIVGQNIVVFKYLGIKDINDLVVLFRDFRFLFSLIVTNWLDGEVLYPRFGDFPLPVKGLVFSIFL